MSDKPFRYSLDVLLRKRRADWKTVKVEETTAGRVVDSKNAEVGKAQNSVSDAEQMLRDAYQEGMAIDPTRHHLMSGYLSQQRVELKQKQQALEKAKDVHERIRTNLEGIGRGVKSLEKHRANKEADHQFEQNNLDQKRMDELWLIQHGQDKE